jgi:hypothetical protein
MSLTDIGIVTAIASAILTIAGSALIVVVRYGLVPYLERRWQEPLEEMIGTVREMKAEVVVISRDFDGHLDWSQREVDQMWKAINRRKQYEKSNPRRGDAGNNRTG